MAQPSKKDLKILQDFAATTIQSFWRMILGKQYIRWHATQYYEKLIDTKRNAYYYYNHLTGEASWLKPSFMGTEDFEVQENYDFYQSDVYKFASYKINKYNLTTYDNNNHRCKIDTEAPLGGWRRLFALYILPSSMFTMFEATTGRAVPNQDVMISFHRISMKSHLEEQVDIHGRPVQFLPQHSFFAFDRPFPNTKKYMVHERVDLFGATRLSRGEAHKSNVVDEEEEKTIIWNEIYHFYCWYVYLPIHFYLPMK